MWSNGRSQFLYLLEDRRNEVNLGEALHFFDTEIEIFKILQLFGFHSSYDQKKFLLLSLFLFYWSNT